MSKALDIAAMALPSVHGLLTEDDRRDITVEVIRAYLRAMADDTITMDAATEAGVLADDKQTGFERVRFIIRAAIRELEPKA